MNHKGVDYTIVQTIRGVWKWQFRIGETTRNGKTETSIELLAMRRVEQRINRALKSVARN